MVVGDNDNESTTTKNAGESLAIMQRYNTGRIAQWSTSRASLKATGCRHWVSACAVLPWQLPWLANSNETHKTLTKHKF